MLYNLPSVFGAFTALSVVVSLSLVLYLHSLSHWRKRTQGKPLPPGPRHLPIIGNLVLGVSKVRPWVGYRDLCNKYGDIVYLRTLGQDNIILGSAAAVSEVMEERTANTSDRLVGPVVRLSGNDWLLGLTPYGQKWRDYRRALWQHFHPGALVKYQPVQRAIVPLFLKKLMEEPEQFRQHIRFVFSATIIKIVYGIDVDDSNHAIIRAIEEGIEGTTEAVVPGRYLVDHLPWLEHIPAWVPGAGFQKKFEGWRAGQIIFKNMPFEQRNKSFTKHAMPSCETIVDQLLSGQTKRDDVDVEYWEELVKSVAAVVHEAGADTSFSAMQAAFLAVSLYPDVQRKAQAELDRVVGPGRLPDFDDLDSLIYVNAILKEVLRWHNVTPLGIPHRTVKDDFFRGYFVPAGSVLIANIWACMHDPQTYDDPEEFRPERFIRDGRPDPDVLDPATVVFGAGRRICPGRHFAQSTLLLNIASVLHVFDISPPLDDDGKPISIHPLMTDSIVAYPEDCRCTIKPRSSEAEALIVDSLARHGD